MSKNPFPGPQPYRAADHARFYAREQAVKTLANRILANPGTTVFGPSGAGKSSLMQAGVIPALELSEGVRVVRVDRWPSDEKPLRWLVNEMFRALDVGVAPDEKSPIALKKAILLAARRSERPILIYLDQIEQLFISEHAASDMNALLYGLAWLIEPARRYHLFLVLSLREDYFGRLRDWTRERPELSASGFRVAPLSVGEMVKAMCRTAAEGNPPSEWDRDEIRSLMLEVRVPGQKKNDAAEVQTAFGQIVCRALWDERLAGRGADVQGANAEVILHRYLDTTLWGLGGLQDGAQKLLEEYFIDGAGHRRLLTEKEARVVLGENEAKEVLEALEGAAVLHAEEHQGGRYFELGHDWLAKKVFERRAERRRAEADRQQREATARKLAEERRIRRRSQTFTVFGLVIVLMLLDFLILALGQRSLAITISEMATLAQQEARDANAQLDAERAKAEQRAESAEAREAETKAALTALKFVKRALESQGPIAEGSTQQPNSLDPSVAREIDEYLLQRERESAPVPPQLEEILREVDYGLEDGGPGVPLLPNDEPSVKAIARGQAYAKLNDAKAVAAACGRKNDPNAPNGSGKVALVIERTGTVSSVALDARFVGTSVGACVDRAFRQVVVQPFEGTAVTVLWSFTVK